ncbi:MAG: hypothetical protein ACOY3X_05120 [Pseudomonadota bacterium]
MPDVVFSGVATGYWLLVGLVALTGLAAGWLAVLLLVYPVRATGIPAILPIQGVVPSRSAAFAAFAATHLLDGLSSPRRFFELLGPDRFRREFGRALKERLDEHVDDVMNRRNERSWAALSGYARNRIYAHVHRRLPYVVDDFVDHVQKDLDDIVQPAALVRRWFQNHPEQTAQIFLTAFGPDLRALLPLAALAGLLVGLPLARAVSEPWQYMALFALAALAGSALVLWRLTRPLAVSGVWPFRVHGVLHRQRSRFMQLLATQVARDALAWPVVVGEFLRGAHAGRVRYMMRREVAGILDVPMFRASMQMLLGPEGFAEVKSSAVEKAVEMLADTPVSAALREHYRLEVARTVEHAGMRLGPDTYAMFWREMLASSWQVILLTIMVAGAGLGWLTSWLMALY